MHQLPSPISVCIVEWGKGRGPSSVQLRVLNEGSSVASAEDICRCLEPSQPGPWEGGGLPTVGLGTALKPLPKLDPPGSSAWPRQRASFCAPLGYSRRCPSDDGGIGGSQGSRPLQLRHLGAAPHRGVVNGLVGQGGLLVCVSLPLHCEGCFLKPLSVMEGTLGYGITQVATWALSLGVP